MFLSLAGVVGAIIAYVIHSHKRQLARKHLEEDARRKAEQEPVRRGVEKAPQKPEEDRRRRDEVQLEADENRQVNVAGEEHQRLEVDVAQPGVEREYQHLGTEEVQTKARHELDSRDGWVQGQVPLDHRPPRRPTESDEKQPLRETRPRQPKPDIVCWQRERRWVLAVEVPEELAGNAELAVYQNGSPLIQDERSEESVASGAGFR